MISINILSQTSAILLTFVLSIIFLVSGIYYSRKYKGLNNYLIANRNIGVFSLTTSFVSSALGAWILFGPASAATWGGIGAVIGYALGTAFPLFILILQITKPVDLDEEFSFTAIGSELGDWRDSLTEINNETIS